MAGNIDRNHKQELMDVLASNLKAMDTKRDARTVTIKPQFSSLPPEVKTVAPSVERLGSNGTSLEVLLDAKCFDGRQKVYKHYSSETHCFMKFSIYIPQSITPEEKFHTVIFLSGIMCNEQNFLFKSAFQKFASEQKLIVVGADTSPRGCDQIGDRDSPIFGRSAGWYVDATQEPWNKNYRMYSYISRELPEIIKTHFPTTGLFGLCGHSMGGNGTIVVGLRNPEIFQSLSLLAPSCNPTFWGEELIFKKFLKEEEKNDCYDASAVISQYSGPFRDILLDQGADDEYLTFLVPEKLKQCADDNLNKNLSVQLRMHEGYDHSYFFVASFIEEHLKHHKRILQEKAKEIN